MKLHKKYKVIWFFILLVCSISFTTKVITKEHISATLENFQKEYRAGENILLDFKLSKTVTTQLFLHSSFGSTLLESSTGSFKIPDFISNKRGIILYKLFYDSEVLQRGTIEVLANEDMNVQLETYIGPPSIIVGGADYTMQVVIPMDGYDNPLPDSTAIDMKYQFLEKENEKKIYTSAMIGWHRIYSYDTSGRLLVASKIGEKTSKEFSVEMLPALPIDFQISSHRKHQYADGNQITEFKTSILRDAYNNVISDGTLVDFSIHTANKTRLHTQSSTINGIAVAKILAPDHQANWQVKAYVSGMAESNILDLAYKPVTDDFDVVFIKKNREIKIGPLLSFMEQLIPDGAIVSIEIFQQGEFLEKKMQTSLRGEAIFRLEEEFYPPGDYDLKIQSLGIIKEFKSIILR